MGFFDFLNPKSNKNLNFTFNSPDHLRYEHGHHVSGPHGGAGRAVKVEPNINGGEGYTVTMYNLDGPHPIWQNNVQMAPKQMKVISEANDKVILRGYGRDSMGASFADYGLTVYYQNEVPVKCVLHMHDRGIDIEYLPRNNQPSDSNKQKTGYIKANKNVLCVALVLVDTLIENYSPYKDRDTNCSKISVKNETNNCYDFQPSDDQLREAFILINSIFPAHNDILREAYSGLWSLPDYYATSYDIGSLRHARNAIDEVLSKAG